MKEDYEPLNDVKVDRYGRYYYVECFNGSWFVCFALSQREAKSSGIREYGRGRKVTARPATDKELDEYCVQKNIYSYAPRGCETFEDVRRFQLGA
jgi:hypothetical protein